MTELHTFKEAAKKLGVTEPWLRRRSAQLPKWKPKGSRIVRFSDEHIERIRAMFSVEPEQPPTVHVEPGSLADLKPLPARGSRARQNG